MAIMTDIDFPQAWVLRVSFRQLSEEKSRNVIISFTHGFLVQSLYLQHSYMGIMNLKHKKKIETKYKNKNYLLRDRVEGSGMVEIFQGEVQREKRSKDGAREQKSMMSKGKVNQKAKITLHCESHNWSQKCPRNDASIYQMLQSLMWSEASPLELEFKRLLGLLFMPAHTH